MFFLWKRSEPDHRAPQIFPSNDLVASYAGILERNRRLVHTAVRRGRARGLPPGRGASSLEARIRPLAPVADIDRLQLRTCHVGALVRVLAARRTLQVAVVEREDAPVLREIHVAPEAEAALDCGLVGG